MAYRFPETSAEDIVDRFASLGWRGEIVGPHGTGKSTLVCTLERELAQRSRRVIKFRLSAGERRLPVFDPQQLGPSTVIIIDGYEQLSWWSRLRLSRLCHSYRCGLLVTSHEPTGLPTLARTSGELLTVQSIVRDLTAAHPPLITAADVQQSFVRHAGNVRETLFELYDLFDQRSRTAAPTANDAGSSQPGL